MFFFVVVVLFSSLFNFTSNVCHTVRSCDGVFDKTFFSCTMWPVHIKRFMSELAVLVVPVCYDAT